MNVVNEIPLSAFGLMTVEEACEARGWVVRTVQKWILDGKLPAVPAGKGRRGVYLLRSADVKEFSPPPMGRPKKDKPAAKSKAATRKRK